MLDTATETPINRATVKQAERATPARRRINPNWVLLSVNLVENAIVFLTSFGSILAIENSGKLSEFIALTTAISVVSFRFIINNKYNISSYIFIQSSIARRLAISLCTISLPILLVAFLTPIFELDVSTQDVVSKVLFIWSMESAICIVTLHTCVRHMLRYWRDRAMLAQRIAIVGAGQHADRLVNWLNITYRDLIEIVGVFEDRKKERFAELPLKHLVQGTIDDLLHMSQQVPIDRVLVALPHAAEERLLHILRRLRRLPADITLAPELIGYATLETRCGEVGTLPFFDVYARPLKIGEQLVKAIFDRVVATGLIILFLPVTLLIAAAVFLESGRPVLFRQARYGLGQRAITVLKFRTMYSEHSDYRCFRQTEVRDARTTRFGRWLRRMSLDELPQLFNVLRGDMSLVGPRPLAIEMRVEDKLNEDLVAEYCLRHRVKPGITGWAQVHGLRGAICTREVLQERVMYDLYYIDNWSLWFDVKILFYTIHTTLLAKNAF